MIFYVYVCGHISEMEIICKGPQDYLKETSGNGERLSYIFSVRTESETASKSTNTL